MHLVEAHVQSLRRVEVPNHGLVAIAGQAPLLVGLVGEVAPAHEHMFACAADDACRRERLL